ncbi:hypothetical protein O1D97_01965 [Marinomonas sp. 15G1-11]|uniref:Uncharacterized protein n=1 Tax=Marinomonas phaeophyticola TaxID=3004091 RepID=A0ABT4JQ01_9GAMM|nr:hypothetical protein [Marinomonas sp. 15G1-11]MCZ2720442.1 hypothetical protein [Marinomonas sp. 15G1-11]
MNEAYLEIVELDNGDIVLRPVNTDENETSEPLAVLTISDDTKAFLQNRYFDLAKCMFHAGIDFVYSEDFREMTDDDQDILDEFESHLDISSTLH